MGGSIVPAPERTPIDPAALHQLKLAWIKDGHAGPVPSNVNWMAQLPAEDRDRLGIRILRKPTRTLSGVAIVAVMTSPARCPHGRCTYCPGGTDLGAPQSYTGEEPSALRGAQFGYDARAITEHRLETLETLGHSTSKVEVIVMGGTFPARPRAYQESVFRGVFDGLNGGPSASLEDAQTRNETAGRRCVSLAVETRPDWCDGRILPDLLRSGVTRIEIGVECLHDDVLSLVGRAHNTGEVAEATREARDRGLKVCYHAMLGLPGMTPSEDLADVTRMLDEDAFRPDMVKFYPTLVLPGTPLYDDWKRGRYEPYDLPTAANLLAEVKRRIPPWVRIQRIQRDIPARLIAAGVRAGNLRQIAQHRLAETGGQCRCLRCREVGRRASPAVEEFDLVERHYGAGGGDERFLSWEHSPSDSVAAFLRLRFPSTATIGGLDGPVVRELKVLGQEVPVGGASGVRSSSYQHRGLGRSLLDRATVLTREAGFGRLYVLSAVGTREYYRHLGFEGRSAHLAKSVFA